MYNKEKVYKGNGYELWNYNVSNRRWFTKIETTFDGDTVWLSIDQMAELFQRDRRVIGKHIRNIFKKGELEKKQCG